MSNAYRPALIEEDVARYRMMAMRTRQTEGAPWAGASIAPGARGRHWIGPGAILPWER